MTLMIFSLLEKFTVFCFERNSLGHQVFIYIILNKRYISFLSPEIYLKCVVVKSIKNQKTKREKNQPPLKKPMKFSTVQE